MTASLSRTPRRWPAVPGLALLLVLVVSLGALHAAQPLHLHHGDTAGLYNEEHVLAALDSVSSDVPLPDEPPAARIDLAPIETPPPAAVAFGTAVARLADSRAPPLA